VTLSRSGGLLLGLAMVNSFTVSERFRLWGELPMPSDTRNTQEYGHIQGTGLFLVRRNEQVSFGPVFTDKPFAFCLPPSRERHKLLPFFEMNGRMPVNITVKRQGTPLESGTVAPL
jgi:hypothetical protein